ncbi:MAG: efflux RND transporter periplasmic adaptor subunit [Gammaproteobacteria bacterium]
MSRARRAALLLTVLALGLAAGWWAGRRDAGEQADTPAAPAPAAQAEAPPSVLEFAASDLLRLEPGPVTRTIPLTGTLKASNQTLVRAKVSGELVEVAVREGTPVRAGQRIARIDPTEFEARVREREAQRRSAEAQVEQARRTRDNNRALLDKGFILQNAFDNAESGYQVTVANRDAATAQLAQARKALADTAVLAPMTGVVAERFAQVGEKVSPDSRILSIVDLSRMEIEAPVPASEIGSVRIGQPVTLRIEGIDAPQTGEVVRINPATAAGTRSVPVYIGLDNRDPRIRAGLFAQGALAVERREGVIAVPAAAVRDAAGRSFVYRIVEGAVEERTVKLGLRDPAARAANGSTGVIEVLEGLAEGDTIVGVNLGPLRPGSRVKLGAAPAAPGSAAGAAGAAPDAGSAASAPR